MTTTTHPKMNIILAMRDKARATEYAAEAETYMAKARDLCTKYGIDPTVLDAKTETKSVRDSVINGQAQPAKMYPCTFGCGTWARHTIDELNACAEKARNANGGNAYAAKKKEPTFEDLFNGFGFTEPRARRSTTGQDRDYHDGTSKARATGTHAYCTHEATKSARAKCRRERGY